MLTFKRPKLSPSQLAMLENGAAAAASNTKSIEELTDALLELGELLAEQDDAIVELAELLEEE